MPDEILPLSCRTGLQLQVEIRTDSSEQKDILIAQISELGYQFEEERSVLKAFISSSDFDQAELDKILVQDFTPSKFMV